MKTLTKTLSLFAVFAVPLMANAQNAKASENPRGIYKLMTVWGKDSLVVDQPYDQYKVCTDANTLTLKFQVNWGSTSFTIRESDGRGTSLKYTGDAPYTTDTTATRIYDSNTSAFTLKWWSRRPSNAFTPENAWCYEKYQSGEYSPAAKPVFDALSSTPAAYNKENPLIGTWKVLCETNKLKGIKKTASELTGQQANFHYAVISPTRFTHTHGHSVPINIADKEKFYINRNLYADVKWIDENLIAVTIVTETGKVKEYSQYEIWERVTDNVSPLTRIATSFPKNTQRIMTK